MATRRGEFDAASFYQALEATRAGRKMSWREVAAAAGVSASTLTRMAQGKRPDVDSLAALASWSGLRVDDFVKTTGAAQPEPLAMISTYLRSDRNLTKESADALDHLIRAAYDRLKKES